jgi:hypothetical protein
MITETTALWFASADPALVAASSSDSSGSAYLWLLGPGAGIGFYALTFLRYRNVNQRHAYERETACAIANPTGFDRKVGHVTDVENSQIRGANSGSPRGRLSGASAWTEE